MTRTSASLRAACDRSWEHLIENKFVAQMADGTLPLDQFRFYIEQNLSYLPRYARMLGFAIANSRSAPYMERFHRALKQIVEIELPANERLLAKVIELGAVSSGGSTPGPACVNYGNFLIATAATGSSNDVIAAMLPCAWSYADIAAHYPTAARHAVYQEWLGVFGGDDYQIYIERLVAESDTLIGDVSPSELERLQTLFATGVQMETAFWTAALSIDA